MPGADGSRLPLGEFSRRVAVVAAARVSLKGYEARRPTRTNFPARQPNRLCSSRR